MAYSTNLSLNVGVRETLTLIGVAFEVTMFEDQTKGNRMARRLLVPSMD